MQRTTGVRREANKADWNFYSIWFDVAAVHKLILSSTSHWGVEGEGSAVVTDMRTMQRSQQMRRTTATTGWMDPFRFITALPTRRRRAAAPAFDVYFMISSFWWPLFKTPLLQDDCFTLSRTWHQQTSPFRHISYFFDPKHQSIIIVWSFSYPWRFKGLAEHIFFC